ncbi:murein transglycosylase domain-containing protein [Oceanospirillum linum]|uniref:Murein transglycosylase C n=1 Tax=Oceanospirillum linum TaxID=966 RepID=A0A1T1HF24_OCELI|nr:murein transglycosylase domain-containing protein [Oceanospirillum linum]OOV88454.1 hypothetical protein BTA35_0202795 [Oceanospirillum linum]
MSLVSKRNLHSVFLTAKALIADHWHPAALLSSVVLLSACVNTSGHQVAQQDTSQITPPKSLVPQPPPGGFSPLFNTSSASVVQPKSQPAVVSPPAVPSVPVATVATVAPAIPTPSPVISSGITKESVPKVENISVVESIPAVGSTPTVEPVQSSEAATWISRFPALAKEYEQYRAELEKEYRQYEQKVQNLKQEASRYWGAGNVHESDSDTYVKYGTGYTSRGEVDFVNGNIVVETVEEQNHKERLQNAIVTTLLTPDNARDPNLFSDQGISYVGPSVLEGQVRDHDGVIVKWEWRANRYADWLVENKLQKVSSDGHTVYRVEIPMEENHQQVRGQKYEALVRKSAQQYGISESLIYSIMETESHFNPYATSHIPAYGLMQVVPSTAGRDVFERIKKRNDQPDRSYLFNPTNNIDTGTAYLSILDDIYLKDVTHPLAREYCVISAYNGGAGNVLKTFSSDRKHAVDVINSLTPQQVYVKLNHSHPSAESRKYIEKVVKAKQKYDAMAVAQNE